MTLIACAAAGGAPGVTTAALALAACWPAGASPVVAEADPSGGDIAAWYGLPGSPGTVSLAAAARRAGGPALLAAHVQHLPGGLAVLPAPPGAVQAAAAAAELSASGWAPVTAAAGHGTLVIADCGRADPGTPAMPLIRAADMLLLVTGTTAADLAHLAARVAEFQAASTRLRLVLSGIRGPWRHGDITAALGARVGFELPADRAAAAMLRGRPVRRGPATRWRPPARLPLLAAAGQAAARIAAAVHPDVGDDWAGLAALYNAGPGTRGGPAAGAGQ